MKSKYFTITCWRSSDGIGIFIDFNFSVLIQDCAVPLPNKIKFSSIRKVAILHIYMRSFIVITYS